MMPTAGAFPLASSVVSLNGGMDREIIAWVATRRGEPPVIPSPVSLNDNYIFLGGNRTADFPIKDIAGITTYAVAGYYIFGLVVPEALGSNFLLGNLPFPSTVDTNEYIPAEYFQQGMINWGTAKGQTAEKTLIPIPSLPTFVEDITDEG